MCGSRDSFLLSCNLFTCQATAVAHRRGWNWTWELATNPVSSAKQTLEFSRPAHHFSNSVKRDVVWIQGNILAYEDCSKTQDAGLVERVVKMVE